MRHRYGLVLGCASADGTVTILKHNEDDSWGCTKVTDGCGFIGERERAA